MDARDVIFEYEQLLIGKKKTISSYFFSYNKENNQKLALIVIRHVIENYLKWSPIETKNWLNKEIIKTMKLDTLIKQIDFPGELNPDEDFFYIAHLLYPNEIKLNKKELVLNVYKRVLSKKLHKFPKNYISENDGAIRACICLQYMISQFLKFSTIEEMYQFFATSDGIKALREYRLYSICFDFFSSPVDYLHESLAPQQKNELYFQYYKFLIADNKQIADYKKSNMYVK